jgi:hypothetical protein
MLFHKQEPLRFRKWIDLENHKHSIAEAVEGSEFPDKVISYLSTAFGDRGWKKKPWKTPVSSLVEGFAKFNPDPSLPILHPPKDNKKSDLDYDGRTWNRFSHILASAYGWTLEYIGKLEVNEALGHVQEVLTSEYLEQEFQHSLSEVSYVYNKTTKKSDYRPMPKPYWMRPIGKPTARVRIRRDMLPVGNLIDASGLGAELGGWNELINNETKKTEPPRNPPTVSPSA